MSKSTEPSQDAREFIQRSGRPEEAAGHLKSMQPLYKTLRGAWPCSDLYFHWVAGRVHYDLKHFEQAEMHLVQVRDGFLDRAASAYNSALVCLDLGRVFEVTGRRKELARTMALVGDLKRGNLLGPEPLELHSS